MQTHEKTGVSKKKAVLHMSDLAGQTMKVEASTGWARGGRLTPFDSRKGERVLPTLQEPD